jgi:AcrR family transcriptional regulator
LRKSTKLKPAELTQDSPTSKEAILSAALKVFARDGFDGASMPKIAKMAQVAPPLIHYYFGSKDTLWRETVDHSLGQLRRDAAAIRNATRSLEPLDRLRALLQALTHHAAQWPDHFVMITAEARSESDRYAWVHEHYTGVIFAEVLGLLQDAKDKKLIEDVAIDQVAFMLIGGMLLYFTVNPAMYGQEIDRERVADEYADLMFKVFSEGVVAKRRK